MPTIKPTFTEEEESNITLLLEQFSETLNGEDASLIERLINFFENKRQDNKRHYCKNCGAKRAEHQMRIWGRAAFGKKSWVCLNCGDSRYKKVIARTNLTYDGVRKMEYKLKRKGRLSF